jgi:predicted metal-dependent phosphoesterase TrpH
MEIARIVPAAKAAGVTALAATDHDRVAAVKALRARCRAGGIGFLSGVEIDSDDDTGRFGHVHILGYGFDEDDAALNALLEAEVAFGRRRLGAGVHLLAARLGCELELERIQAWWNRRVPYRELGRKSVADYLVAAGLSCDREGTIREIERLGQEAVAGGHTCPSCPRVIDAIHAAGGLAVLAHPRDLRREGVLQFAQWGIDGLEVHHAKNAGHEQRLLGLATELDLAVTGGGDWHGTVQELPPGTWPSTAPGSLYHALVRRYRDRFGRDPL